LFGVLAVPESDEQRVPGVVVLGGSSGGIPTQLAVALAERGFACFGLGYFGVAGLKPALAEIPVELVERAVDWLARNPRVSPGGVCLFGVSKGAELALLAASLLPDKVRAVVAVVPSSVVFAGVDFTGGDGMSRSSWT
jgi:dienelactone hydrolase